MAMTERRELRASDTVSPTLGESPAAEVFQFCGLLWATEYNARAAGLERDLNAQTVNAMNTLLMAYAALEALVLETALSTQPALYADAKFRRAGILQQYREVLDASGRNGEAVRDIVGEVSAHRVALTHSEPDNKRSAALGEVISATDAARFAAALREVAEWLWQGQRPKPVSHAFNDPNVFLQER
jgi:hypothetical protein